MRAGTVFTTHTPVPAGIDRFPRELVAEHLDGDRRPARSSGSSRSAPRRTRTMFNMAHMGLRLGGRANGVSLLHGEVSREMFAGLWPGFDANEVPISSVTNGVHAPSWMSREILEIAEREVGIDVMELGGDWTGLDRVGDAELWSSPPRAARAAGRRDPAPDQGLGPAARA